MRDIRFRAWDKIKQTMVMLTFPPENAWFDKGFNYEFEIMQYTGLKDKNGVEIFEGDIVEYVHDYIQEDLTDIRKAEVVFQHGGFQISNSFLVDWGDRTYKIIGNVFENPYLNK